MRRLSGCWAIVGQEKHASSSSAVDPARPCFRATVCWRNVSMWHLILVQKPSMSTRSSGSCCARLARSTRVWLRARRASARTAGATGSRKSNEQSMRPFRAIRVLRVRELRARLQRPARSRALDLQPGWLRWRAGLNPERPSRRGGPPAAGSRRVDSEPDHRGVTALRPQWSFPQAGLSLSEAALLPRPTRPADGGLGLS